MTQKLEHSTPYHLLIMSWRETKKFEAKEIDAIFLFGDAICDSKIIGLPCFGSFPTGKHNYSNKKFSHKCEKLVAEEKNVGRLRPKRMLVTILACMP